MLTRDHVHWAYRLLLDREPENAGVLRFHMQNHGTTQSLRQEFMRSAEYQAHNPMLEFADKVIIYETPLGFRMALNLGDGAVSGVILLDSYEPDETEFIRRYCLPGQAAFDIGANIGYYTLLMATLVGSEGHVHAFEPREDFCALVSKSLAENDYRSRCSVHACALADYEGVAKFRVQRKANLDRSDPNYYSTCYLAQHESDEAENAFIPVRVDILDKTFTDSSGKRVALIKIDAEGAEYLVFRGAQNLLRRDKPIILSEIFDAQLRNVSRVDTLTYVNFLGSLGYKCYRLEEKGNLAEISHPVRFFNSAEFRKRPVWNMVFKPERSE
jgi:FkbM family methyltransferase